MEGGSHGEDPVLNNLVMERRGGWLGRPPGADSPPRVLCSRKKMLSSTYPACEKSKSGKESGPVPSRGESMGPGGAKKWRQQRSVEVER